MKRLCSLDVHIALGLAAVFSAAEIIASLRQGTLSVPPTYDDIVYFVDAAQRLQTLYDHGTLALAQTFANAPPHAPLATLVGMLGFGLFGMHAWAVPIVNGIWVFLVLLGLRLYLIEQPLAVYVAAAVMVLAWPLTAFLVIEGRPDIVWGLLTVVGCFYILSSTWLSASRGRVLMAALFAGVDLLIKPSASPLTIILFGWAALLASAIDYIACRKIQPVLRDFLRANLLFATATILLALPYYVFGLRTIIDYLVSNVFGAPKSIWASKLTPIEHANYYLWGIGGQMMMGPWLMITVALLVSAGVLQYRWLKNNWLSVAAVAAWGLVAYLLVTLPSTKSPFIGAIVSCTILLLFILALASILAKASEWVAQGSSGVGQVLKSSLCAGLAIFAIATFNWHRFYSTGGRYTSIENHTISAKRFELIDKVVDEMAHSGHSIALYMPTITAYLNGPVFQFAFLQRGMRDATARDIGGSGKLDVQLAALGAATDVLVLEPNDPEILPFLPSTAILRQVTEKIAADPELRLKKMFETANSAHHVALYQRRLPFEGVHALSGFLPTEGPFPQWNLSYIRWATSQEAHLALTVSAFNMLYLKSQSAVDDQSIAVSVAGRELGVCRLPVAWVTKECEIPLAPDAKAGGITLRFSRLGPKGDRPAFFQKIEVR